jgi:hypothetical protein
MDIFNFFLGRVWFSEDRISTLSAVLFAALGILAAVIGYQAERADANAEIWSGKATQQTMQIASTLIQHHRISTSMRQIFMSSRSHAYSRTLS